ncbi:unnamed protein product [Rhizoctonia solani]|uniref:Protein kinase domain-containing protein n=1 Tax=Rhizoctonia solani TaxID=456999 RepID=A0A8H3GLY7_9AGAM|nr:unnamed protein product [Rhizoctonia solani]
MSRLQRQTQPEPTSRLPIEILLYIFYLCPLSDVVRLIRVNKYFYQQLHPLLFETLNFHADKSPKRSITACTLILRNPSLGRAVLRFDPAGGAKRIRIDKAEKLSQLQTNAIVHMTNLVDLNIWGCAILPQHLEQIANRPVKNLRRLTLMQVIPDDWLGVVPELIRAHPKLIELRLWPTLRADQFVDTSQPRFALNRANTPHLRSFNGSLDVLGDLLEDTEKRRRETKEPVELITHATIASPILLHEHFEDLRVLKENGSSLRSFQCHVVVGNWHAMEVIAKAMPQIEVLKLHVLASFKRDRFVEFINQVEGLEHFIHLRELHLNSRDVTAFHPTAFSKKGAERTVVEKLSQECKTLRVITMPPYRPWIMQPDGNWNVLSGQELSDHIRIVRELENTSAEIAVSVGLRLEASGPPNLPSTDINWDIHPPQEIRSPIDLFEEESHELSNAESMSGSSSDDSANLPNDNSTTLHTSTLMAEDQKSSDSEHQNAARETVRLLALHGCENLTDHIDEESFIDFPITGGAFGDVYHGNLRGGLQVAVKTPRILLHTLGENPEFLKCTEVCEGVAYLHAIGIVHGDLKGENVLISSEGAAVVSDFGGSLLKNRSLKIMPLEKGLSLTSRWAAPELFEADDEDPVNTKGSDIYALGMTILEAISGRLPWYWITRDVSIIRQVCSPTNRHKRPVDETPANSRDGDKLWNLLVSCWSFESNARPTALEVGDIVRNITPEGLKAYPPPTMGGRCALF